MLALPFGVAAAINARHQAEKKRLQMAMAPVDNVPPARTSTPGELFSVTCCGNTVTDSM